jgi:type VI secretion system protein ImpG
LSLDTLSIYLSGDEGVAHRLYEQLFANCVAIAVMQPAKRQSLPVAVLPAAALEPGGLSDQEALLPTTGPSFGGYRLLKEYSALPARYLFAHINGLLPALQQIDSDDVEILIVFNRADNALERTVDAANFTLHCTPAINLFAKRAQRINVKSGQHEHHVVADNGQPMNFEIHSITAVSGFDESGVQKTRDFRALYTRHDIAGEREPAYYAIRRVPRVLSEGQRRRGPRTGYIGTELYVSLVDPNEAPVSGLVTHLMVDTLCSNRDLPITLPVGSDQDFSFDNSFPVQGIRCIKGPSRPIAPTTEGECPWRLLSHLQLNYLSLVQGEAGEGAAALRELLELYGLDERSPLHKQRDGVLAVASEPAICRVPVPGPIAFGRGVQVDLTLDERAFEGSGIMVLGTILERFLARHSTLNSFVQLKLMSQSRGEVMRWKPRIGLRSIA